MAYDDIIVNIPKATFEDKIAKIKELVDNFPKDCDINNIYDEQPIDERLEVFLKSENFKPSQLKDNELLKILIKDDKQSLLESGHSQSDNDKLIKEFFNYCVTKCIKEEKLEFMIVVTVLLPYLVNKSFKSTLTNLIMQLSYVKIPSKWCKGNFIQFNSIRENQWGYKFPEHKSPLSQLDKLGKIPLHSVTLCYIPLPGLCTYPESSGIFNTLFPHHLSPFAKLIISNSSDILDISHTTSGIYESAPIQATIKFKWHAFARWRFFGIFFVYLIHFILFTVAIYKTNKTTEGRWLMITSIIMEAILIFNVIRYAIISILNRIVRIGILLIYRLLALVLSTVTGFLFLYNDTSETFFIIQSTSVFLLWIGFIEHLCAFKNIGIFIIVIRHICRKILWPLFLLVIILFAVAHSTTIYLNHTKVVDIDEEYKTGTFAAFYKLLINIWDFFLNDYSFLVPWKDNYFENISKFVFSLFTYVIILNLLIALVNNVYEEVLERAHAEWSIVRAKFIVFIELLFMVPSERQNSDYFPSTITYEAFTEDVNKWPRKLKEDDIPIPWEGDSTDIIKSEMDKMKREMIKKMTDELEELRQKLVKGNLLN